MFWVPVPFSPTKSQGNVWNPTTDSQFSIYISSLEPICLFWTGLALCSACHASGLPSQVPGQCRWSISSCQDRIPDWSSLPFLPIPLSSLPNPAYPLIIITQSNLFPCRHSPFALTPWYHFQLQVQPFMVALYCALRSNVIRTQIVSWPSWDIRYTFIHVPIKTAKVWDLFSQVVLQLYEIRIGWKTNRTLLNFFWHLEATY